MVEETTLLEHLHQLIVVRSEEEIEDLLQLLWQTRKVGLSASQKSSVQSLLKLPSSGDLDPILAALRSLVRSCAHKGSFPRVKSMTWTVEDMSEMSTHRVAINTLKLQDYAKSPSNEMEAEFQLTRDTLEAVLRSMTYINEQLSRFVRSSSVPLHKKQKQ